VLGKTPMAMVRTTSGTAMTISRKSMSGSPFHASLRPRKTRCSVQRMLRGEAGQVRYWQYGQAEKSPDLAILDLSRFLA
jgi:hypothetical protein